MYGTIGDRKQEKKVGQGVEVIKWVVILMVFHGAYTLFTLGFERIYG